MGTKPDSVGKAHPILGRERLRPLLELPDERGLAQRLAGIGFFIQPAGAEPWLAIDDVSFFD